MSGGGLSLPVRIYYRGKRFVPRRLRWWLRRVHARRVLGRSRGCWPIDEAAGRAPDGWPGWPDGKRFALVLTHDVETRAGLDKVRPLAELELELGFRSSFNFVPEGGYRVPPALREWLTANGFEVGVHDLRHDGMLYRSRDAFARDAQRINRHLREWGAAGFRSGFMMHRLDWLHDLEIRYDSSTFDTDPFEPQPDGCGSVFPFRVLPEGKAGGGYIELPYTMPQDSTLFLLLGEVTPAVWQRKLDWLAARGGMALVNVHPDYLHFGEGGGRDTVPAAVYRELLAWVRARHGGGYWQPLAREVAAHADRVLPAGPRRPRRRVAMVSFSFYETDNRVIRYAEALAARGDEVEVLALRRTPDVPHEEVLNGVRVVRIRDRFDKSSSSRLGHLLPVLAFIRRAQAWLRRSHGRRPYDLLHIHNMPDFVVFAGWYPKWKGAKVILDIHDIVPELYASKFGRAPHGPMHAALLWMERRSARFADHVIIANHLWRDRYAARTGTTGRCTAIINHVDDAVFKPAPRRRADGRKIILFPGGLQWHQGVDVAIDAFKRVHDRIPAAEFHIYGDGIARESLRQQARDLGLNGSVRFFEPRPLREIAAVMADADLGVVPKRADSFGNEAYSTKIMEFMAAGVPVVVSDTMVDRHYFDDSVARFFPSGDAGALAEALADLLDDPGKCRDQAGRALHYVREHCWERRRADYLALVDGLLDGGGGRAAAAGNGG